MPPRALLAIRSDIQASIEPEYLEWLTREHTIERLSIDGFLSARVLQSPRKGFGRYLILYGLADASVVDSGPYLQRLNKPTPWTTRMMPHLGNFFRGGGAITAEFGVGYGAAIVPVLTEAEVNPQERGALEVVSRALGIVAVRILRTDTSRTTVATNERELRSGDQSFRTLVMLEALDERSAKQAAKELPHWDEPFEQNASHSFPIYSEIFHLTR